MNEVLEFFFGAYFGVSPLLVGLEMTAVFLGVLSVWFAHKENILVFPTGLVSTGIFVYILWVYGLLGDMLINGYYTAMSIYGWWFGGIKKPCAMSLKYHEFPEMNGVKPDIYLWVLFCLWLGYICPLIGLVYGRLM